MCMQPGCIKARANAIKKSPTRGAYTPKKTYAAATNFGSPKVRMSFGSRNR